MKKLRHPAPVPVSRTEHKAPGLPKKGRLGERELFTYLAESTRDAVLQLAAFYETVHPRMEDLDLAYNTIGGGDATSGRVTVTAGGSETVRVNVRPGWSMHLRGYDVRNPATDPGLGDVDVELVVTGTPLSNVPRNAFARPITLDRSSVVELVFTNTGGADVTLDWSLDGWLREHVEVL